MGLVWTTGLTGSVLANKEMLKSGWAKPNYDANSHSEELKSAYDYAEENKLGVNSVTLQKS